MGWYGKPIKHFYPDVIASKGIPEEFTNLQQRNLVK